MQNFEYFTPTKVLFGKGTENQVGELIQSRNCKRVLIHYGQGHVVSTGLLEKITLQLSKLKIQYELLGGVKPNARLSKVHEGILICREKKIDFILAIGGGSVIDSAKAIGYGVYYDGEVWDLFEKKAFPKKSLPVGVVLTHAASGSEMSSTAGITNDIVGNMKRGCTSDIGRCVFAVMNPELTMSLSEYQTSCGCVDIFMHTVERYFSSEEGMEITDSIAEALMRTVIKNSLLLKENPNDYNARAEIMWAGSLSHNGLTGCGSQGDWACHQLEHALSGIYDVTHAAGLSAIWGSWARYVVHSKPERFAAFAERVMGVSCEQRNVMERALCGIKEVENFFIKLNMPISLKQLKLGLTNDSLRKIVYYCSYKNTRCIGDIKKIDCEGMYTILKNALE